MAVVTAPFCRDCRHCIPSPVNGFASARCEASRHVDPVGGEMVLNYCHTQRTSPITTDCGPDGKWFDPVLQAA